jgi:uncharacterized damage-inducible protein DinB
MGPVVSQLLDWVEHVFSQEGWHVSLLDSVTNLTAAQAAWVPAPGRNSIWKIVEHVALWKEEGARRIMGADPRPAGWEKDNDWRSIGEATAERWGVALQRLRAAHTSVVAELATRRDVDLNSPPPGSRLPLLATIRGLVVHDSYHCGQICSLRALQGIPAKIW